MNCSTILSIPMPPTYMPTGASELDGPVRSRRRTRVAARQKTTFFEREKGDDGTGHTVWADEQVVVNWGTTTAEGSAAGSTNPPVGKAVDV